jgi:hypothetical protein
MSLFRQSFSIFQAEYMKKKERNKKTKHNRKLGDKVKLLYRK